MAESIGVNQMTPEQRLTEIAACLAQGIVNLQKQGLLAPNIKEFSDGSKASLDFGADSGLTVDSGSISDIPNYEGATHVVECH